MACIHQNKLPPLDYTIISDGLDYILWRALIHEFIISAITVHLRLSHHHAPPQHPPSLNHRRPRTKTKPTRTRPHPPPLPCPDRRWTWPVSSLSGFCWIPWTAGWVQTAPPRAWPQHTGPWWSCFWWWRTWSRSGTWWRSMSWPWATMMLSREHSYRWEKWAVNHPSPK